MFVSEWLEPRRVRAASAGGVGRRSPSSSRDAGHSASILNSVLTFSFLGEPRHTRRPVDNAALPFLRKPAPVPPDAS